MQQTTDKHEKVVIVCVKGGGRGACAMEREWIDEVFGPCSAIPHRYFNCPIEVEVWNYNGGQIAKKFGLDPDDYDVEDTE
jgi:hypothetical protein